MNKAKEPAKETGKVLAENRKARFNYHILETIEAGIVLTGAEIKSIRAGGVSIGESFVSPRSDGLYLIQAHIKPYSHCKDREYDPVRPRKLLLHKTEVNKLRGRVEQKGLTIVPLQIHLKRGFAKVLIALAKGKAAPDKRETIKARESEREMARAIKRKR